jgi:ribosomal protein S18 acetylase RimI-like enzyme
MKKSKLIIVFSFIVITILGVMPLEAGNSYNVSIQDYQGSHKANILEIAFQSPNLFFSGYEMIPAENRAVVDEINHQEMDASCDEPLKYKKVLLEDGEVAGFVIYFKAKEQSVESIKRILAEKNIQLTTEQILAQNPSLKLTDAECVDYVLLESLAVSVSSRGKGYGRKLVGVAVTECKNRWPQVNVIKLHVNENNTVARNLYESEGFVLSEFQPFKVMKVVQYEKSV